MPERRGPGGELRWRTQLPSAKQLVGRLAFAFVEVDPVQAFPGMASSRQLSGDISGAGVRCAAQLNRAGPCWTFWNRSTKSSISGSYSASWHEAEPAKRAGHPGAGTGGLERGILQDPHRRWLAPGLRDRAPAVRHRSAGHRRDRQPELVCDPPAWLWSRRSGRWRWHSRWRIGSPH